MNKKILSVLIAALAAEKAYAACSWRNPGDCLKNPAAVINPVVNQKYRVKIKNLCAKRIVVGIHYQPITNGSISTLSCVGCENSSWVGTGWWELGIGEEKYIADTNNRYVYFHAFSKDGKTTWGNANERREINKELYPTFQTSMGPTYRDFLQTFSCN